MADVLSVIHRVHDPRAAAAFCAEVLGLPTVEVADHLAVVDNGAVRLRLEATEADALPAALELELDTGDVSSTCAALLSRGDVDPLGEATRTGPRLERRLQGPQGLTLRVSHVLTEDELGVLPGLPTVLEWTRQADRFLREVLASVPLAFRDLARRRATEESENVAVEGGRVQVERDDAVRGVLRATPDFQREALRRAIEAQGVDLSEVLW